MTNNKHAPFLILFSFHLQNPTMQTSFIKRKIDSAEGSPTKRAAIAKIDLGIARSTKPLSTQPASAWMKNFNDTKILSLFDGNTAGLAYFEKGNIGFIQSISMIRISGSDPSKMVGHVGNSLASPIPGILTKEEMLSNILGIMEKTDAEEEGFVFLDSDLKQPLQNQTGTEDTWDISDKLPENLKGPDNFPVLTILPKFIPMGWGKQFPQGDANADDVQAACQDLDTRILIWARALTHLVKNNVASSIALLRQMENILPFIPEANQDEWRAALKHNHGSQNGTPVTAEVMPLFPDSTDAKNIFQAVNLLGHARWEEFIQDEEAKRAFAEMDYKGATSSGTDFKDLADAIMDSKSSLDPGQKKATLAATSILCMRKDSPGRLHFPLETDINQAVVSNLKNGVRSNTPIVLYQAMTNFHLVQSTMEHRNVTAESVPVLYNRIWWTKLFTGETRTMPFISANDMTEGETWSAYNLAPQDVHSDSYKAKFKQTQDEHNQEAAGWADKNKNKSSTTPFRSTEISSCQGVCQMIANLGQLMLFFVANDDHTAVITDNWPWLTVMAEQLIQAILNNTPSDGKGSEWIREMNDNYAFTITCPTRSAEMGLIQRGSNPNNSRLNGGEKKQPKKGDGNKTLYEKNQDGVFYIPVPGTKPEFKDIPQIKVGNDTKSLCMKGCLKGSRCAFHKTEKGCFNYHFEKYSDFHNLDEETKKLFDKCAKNSTNLALTKPFTAMERKKKQKGKKGGAGMEKGPNEEVVTEG